MQTTINILTKITDDLGKIGFGYVGVERMKFRDRHEFCKKTLPPLQQGKHGAERPGGPRPEYRITVDLNTKSGVLTWNYESKAKEELAVASGLHSKLEHVFQPFVTVEK